MRKRIQIGRNQAADIHLNDKSLSRVHCEINFKEGEGWVLTDGCLEKPSTNGTWLYISNALRIEDGMVFKYNQAMFQCNYENIL
jgi:pSer/pThr/pTyr-binding forkhead associated (FHA) protein